MAPMPTKKSEDGDGGFGPTLGPMFGLLGLVSLGPQTKGRFWAESDRVAGSMVYERRRSRQSLFPVIMNMKQGSPPDLTDTIEWFYYPLPYHQPLVVWYEYTSTTGPTAYLVVITRAGEGKPCLLLTNTGTRWFWHVLRTKLRCLENRHKAPQSQISMLLLLLLLFRWSSSHCSLCSLYKA
jgi:hypothetical protein